MEAKNNSWGLELDKALDILLEEDTKYIRELIRKKKRNYYILSLTGLAVFSGSMFAILILAPIFEGGFIFNMYYWVLLILAVTGAKLVQHGAVGYSKLRYILNPAGGNYEIFSELTCTKCGYKTTRKYIFGDYVGRITDETCEKCGGRFQISAIYSKPERELEATGTPILFLGGTTQGAQHIAKVIDKLAPFKIAFRFKNKNID